MAFSSRVPFVYVRKRASVCWSSSSINKDPEAALRIEKRKAGHGILSVEYACSSLYFDVAICSLHPMVGIEIGRPCSRIHLEKYRLAYTYPAFPLFLTHEER